MVDIFQKNNASYIKMVDGVHLIGWDGYFKFKKKRIMHFTEAHFKSM
ncbi:MAG: hypothetical protein Q4Q55_07870 [Methanobrevibacter sp.]|nr:hypothetical protein [Methanobrevibacter sp.]